MNKGLSNKLKKAFPDVVLNNRVINFSYEIKDPQWLTGFVDGEGCFYTRITKSKSDLKKFNIALVFSISQHVLDLLLFEHIIEYLNCGIIEQVSTRKNSMVYVVYKFSDIVEKIIPFFEKNPLLGIKRLDYPPSPWRSHGDGG